jgi:arylsulfatase A-like enzyme
MSSRAVKPVGRPSSAVSKRGPVSALSDLMNAVARPNVVVVTVDSCRFDSAALANTPTLDALGQLRRAVTAGSFTLPAHMAFFSGYFPNVMELPHEDYYSREKRQLWRLSRAKEKQRDSYHLRLEGDTLWEGFRAAGYHLLGAGGVRWFLTETLTAGFDRFVFRGPADYHNWFAERSGDDFVLARPEELVDQLPAGRPWFLFVNALETHAPYNDGVLPLPEEARQIIKRGSAIWAGRTANMLDTDLTPADYHVLHRLQVRAM